jgi:hypothetical protein
VSDAATHPSPDELADHGEGLLPADQASRLDLHLAECAVCRGFVDALADVRGVLGREDAEPMSMPDDVRARIDAALAEAASATSPAAEQTADRAAVVSIRAERHRRRTRLMAAAAVVGVLLIGGGVAVSRLPAGDGSGNSDSSAGGRVESGGQSDNSSKAEAPRGLETKPTVNPNNFDSVVPRAVRTDSTQPPPRACVNDVVPAYRPNWVAAAVTWSGKPTWLLVNPAKTDGYVVSCAGIPRVLYHHVF